MSFKSLPSCAMKDRPWWVVKLSIRPLWVHLTSFQGTKTENFEVVDVCKISLCNARLYVCVRCLYIDSDSIFLLNLLQRRGCLEFLNLCMIYIWLLRCNKFEEKKFYRQINKTWLEGHKAVFKGHSRPWYVCRVHRGL